MKMLYSAEIKRFGYVKSVYVIAKDIEHIKEILSATVPNSEVIRAFPLSEEGADTVKNNNCRVYFETLKGNMVFLEYKPALKYYTPVE